LLFVVVVVVVVVGEGRLLEDERRECFKVGRDVVICMYVDR
jgi:hypothetical protein